LSTSDEAIGKIVDRLAITDVVNRFFELTDSKRWDLMDEVFAEDATAQETPDRVFQGRTAIVDNFRALEDTDEIILFDHIGSFTPVIHGDTAEASVRVRSMHYGVGPRQGKSYESLFVLLVDFVRTQDGWRFKHYDFRIAVRLGSLGELYAPELGRIGRRAGPDGTVPIST
jgi:SnoaL-like domain